MKVSVDRIPSGVLEILATLKFNGDESFVAGGAVRDLLLEREPNDWDVATSALPEEVLRLFPNSSPTGIDYGTITVHLPEMNVEVTTFRKDGEYVDGRRPKAVEFAKTAKEDVLRRDFTVNGLLLSANGEVVDYVDGLSDIHNKVIRAIGNPVDRFQQDKLRMMRCIRQATCLGFKIDHTTWFALRNISDLVLCNDGNAIRTEMEKILVHDNVRTGMELFFFSGMLYFVMPEVHAIFGYDQKNPHHMRNLWDHTMMAMECVPATVPLRLGALFHDIGKPVSQSFGEDGVAHYFKHHLDSADMAFAICERLKYPHAIRDKVVTIVREHMCRHHDMHRSGIKKFINRVGEDNLQDLFDLQFADAVASRPPYKFNKWFDFQKEVFAILASKEPMSVNDLAINGHDLMRLGVNPGKEIGIAKVILLQIVLDDPEKNTNEYLSNYIQELIRDCVIEGKLQP